MPWRSPPRAREARGGEESGVGGSHRHGASVVPPPRPRSLRSRGRPSPPPNSGLPEFGIKKSASRAGPTCVGGRVEAAPQCLADIMLSRTADNLYWLARYIERAEFVARILEATQRLTAMPLTYVGGTNEWESAIATAGSAKAF